MKIDLVRTIVAICIGALLGWGFYAMAQDSMNGQPLGFAIGIETVLLGIGLVGIGQLLQVGGDVHGGLGPTVDAADAPGGEDLDARHVGDDHGGGHGGGRSEEHTSELQSRI